MNRLQSHIILTFRWAMRDKILHAVLGLSLFLFLLVPTFSLFSMRQVQETAITLSLSAISFVLMVLAIFLGSSSIWRDIEKKYTTSILTLPVSRGTYLLGKFFGISLFLALTGIILALLSAVIIVISVSHYPSEIPVNWFNFGLAVSADVLKYILLTAVAILFSCVSTSFFFPLFATLAVFLAGSGSQEVFEFISGRFGEGIHPGFLWSMKLVYYLVPNFASFNLKLQAIYGLQINPAGLGLTGLYFLVYTSLLLCISSLTFQRRQLP